MTYTVYAIRDGATGPIRYVGVTGKPLHVRLAQHLGKARRAAERSDFQLWLLEAVPVIGAMAVVDGVAAAGEAERVAIEDARACGEPLLNQWDGGAIQEGVHRSERTKKLVSAASKEAWRAKGDAIVAAQNAGKAKPEARGRYADSQRIVWSRPGRVKQQCLSHAEKLTEADVRDIKIRLARGETQTSIGKLYGVGQPYVSLIKKGRSWRHVTITAAVAARVSL
jgi:hypothetical protein